MKTPCRTRKALLPLVGNPRNREEGHQKIVTNHTNK